MMFYEMTLFPKLIRPATLLVPVTIQEQWTKIRGLGMFGGLLLLYGDYFTTPWWQDPGFPSVNNQEIPWDFGLSTETPGFSKTRGSTFLKGKKGKATATANALKVGVSAGESPQGWAAPKKKHPQKKGLINTSGRKAGVFFFGGGYRYIHHDGTLHTPLNRYVCRLSHEKDKNE